jgi:hypothetical protein
MNKIEFKKEIINDLNTLLNEQLTLFSEAKEREFSIKPAANKWSKKEILGHLIDSASNNIQRFIRGQYEKGSSIRYDQDTWVRLNDYKEALLSDLIQLWFLLNRQILRIIENMPVENLEKTSRVNDQVLTLAYLMEDYVRHLRHHLAQINSSSP